MAITQPDLARRVMFALDKLLQMASDCKCTFQPSTGITENAFFPELFLFFLFILHIIIIALPNPHYLKSI